MESLTQLMTGAMKVMMMTTATMKAMTTMMPTLKETLMPAPT
jgi:hypothetical protein